MSADRRAPSAEHPLRVLVDGTPLLGQRTGIGRYTDALLRELAVRPDVDVTVTAFTARGQIALRAAVPGGVVVRGAPVPARPLRALWQCVDWPPTELLAGDADVLHATNFVLPPSKRARGVVTVHDLAFLDRPEFLSAPQRDLTALVERSVARAAIVCTPSDAVAQQVTRRLGVPADRIVVTPLGVDRSWMDAASPTEALRATLGLPPRYLLFVGAAQPPDARTRPGSAGEPARRRRSGRTGKPTTDRAPGKSHRIPVTDTAVTRDGHTKTGFTHRE